MELVRLGDCKGRTPNEMAGTCRPRTQQFFRFLHAGCENWSYILLPALKLEFSVERLLICIESKCRYMTNKCCGLWSSIRIMSIENLQRESSSTAGSKHHHQLQGATVEQNNSERVHKPRQSSGAGHRKSPMAHESQEEISTKPGHPPGTPSDYLRRRVLPMETESSSPQEKQHVAGNSNPSQVHLRPESSGLTSAQLQLQRQHQSL